MNPLTALAEASHLETVPAPQGIATRQSELPNALLMWLETQASNVNRHAAALRPFKRADFDSGLAAPSEGHIQAVNKLLTSLRAEQLKYTNEVTRWTQLATAEPTKENLQQVVTHKDQVHRWTLALEKIWDFYLFVFGQRLMPMGNFLLGCDRIGLDCYQAVYRGIGTAKSVPAPPPFSYMQSGFAPATYRRGIPMRRLGQQLNPFPLVQLPYHRLVNPWTLGAILHEVSHNLHTELGLARVIPLAIARRLLKAGFGREVAFVWTRWNRETFADMSGLLLGGPLMIGSLMDVVGRAPAAVLAFDPRGVHPTPYLRVLISVELLRRMGFTGEADEYRRAWLRIYPHPRVGNFPKKMLDTFPEAVKLVVDTICYQPFETLGKRSLAQVMRFEWKDQHMIEEASRRLAAGTDPGILPERFMIGAARLALIRRLAKPGVIAENFYKELARR